MLVSLVTVFCIALGQIFERSNGGASNEPELPYRGCRKEPELVESCGQVKECGVYRMMIANEEREVYCEVTKNKKFIVVQRRDDYGDPVDYFFRGYKEYRNGFGNVRGQFWLGNRALRNLTADPRDLYIVMKDFAGGKVTIIAHDFQILEEKKYYELRMSSVYPKDLGYTFERHNGSKFSTKDIDFTANNCVQNKFKGGWWYRTDCSSWSNLNGLYLRGEHKPEGQGVNFFYFRGDYYSLKLTEMKFEV